jgi:hypothetical protein
MSHRIESPMIRRALRAVIIGGIAGILYAAFGWVGLALLALFELADISEKLSEIRDRLSARSVRNVSD